MRMFIVGLLCLLSLNVLSVEPTPSDKIDFLIQKKATELKLPLKELVNDDLYVRRVYLDTVGRIPTISEIEDFRKMGPNKRSSIIVHLLKSEGHVQYFYHFWADLLRIRAGRLNENSNIPGTTYVEWMKDQIRQNVPYSTLVKTLLTSTGDIWTNPAVGYYLRDVNMPLDNFSTTSQVFLGIDLSCAQCHDDPFQDWTQMDFYNMAAFFTPNDTLISLNEDIRTKVNEFNKIINEEQNKRDALRRKLRQNPNDEVAKMELAKLEEVISGNLVNSVRNFIQPSFNFNIQVDKTNTLKLPHDYKYPDAKPNDAVMSRTVLGQEVEGALSEDARTQFVDWLVSPNNPTFTKNIVNRLWEHLMGSPLIPNMDNMYANQEFATNKELIKYLEQLLIELNYDTKRFQYWILNTKAYQRLAYEDVDGEYFGQSPVARRLTASQIWDSYLTLRLPNVDYYSPVSWDSYTIGSIDVSELTIDKLKSVVDNVSNLDKHISENAEKQGNLLLVRASFINDSNRYRSNSDLLYKFGFSDRSLVNDSNQEGSVAQVLLLSNGPILDIITNEKSVLMTGLKDAPDKIDYIWKSLLGRQPTMFEKAEAKSMTDKDVIWVLLNSQEFRFTP